MENTLKLSAYLNTHCTDENGNKNSFYTEYVKCIERPLWFHTQGLQYTATGYGKRIPTEYMVRFNGRWRRVYCCIYSNSGTLYIGKLKDNLFININRE